MKKLVLSLSLAFIGIINGMASGHTVSISSTNATCHGICDGSATANVSGGVGPFSYLWTSAVTTATTTGMCAGSYTVTVTDNSDMSTATASVTIVEPLALTVGSMSPIMVCSGSCVTLTPMVTGGTPAYTFSWSPSAGLSSPVIATPTACPTATTTYNLYVTDGHGCIGSGSVTVSLDGPVTSAITSVNASSCTACDGSATITPIGGSGPYVYSWTPAGITTATATGLCAGTYSVEITDMVGCTTTNSTTIFSTNDVVADFTMVPDSANPYNFFAFNTSTGPGLIYDWYVAGVGSSTVANPSFLFPGPGTYNIHFEIFSPSCVGTDTLDVPFTVTGVPSTCLALFNIGDDTTSTDPNSHYIYNLSYGSGLSYLWDFGDGTSSTSMTPSHIYSGTGPYSICLTVDNGMGCSQTYCDSLISADSINRSSGTLQFTVYDVPPFHSITTGVASQNEISGVSVSPNPFTDNTTFNINSKRNDVYSFELTDVLGKKVRSMSGISDKQFQISRSGLQNGVYFYKIYSSESIVGIGKLIIN